MRGSMKLVSIGHVLNEIIVFSDGRREPSVLGGPSAYFSVVSARLGIPTGIVTKVGSDAPGHLLQPLKEAGVDLTGISFKSDATTTNELVYASDGNKELKYLKHASPIIFEDIPDGYHQVIELPNKKIGLWNRAHARSYTWLIEWLDWATDSIG